MTKQFDDYFYDNFIQVRRTNDKPYVAIVGESNDEMTIVHLDKSTLGKFIEHLQEIHKEM